MTHIALVSADAALALDEDMPPLIEALQRLGATVSTPSWDDPAIRWSGFDLALLRSTWDYVDRIDEFLAWAKNCASQTMLRNPVDVVAWNTDKHYLAHMHAAGVAVVPTRFVEPGERASAAVDAFLAGSAQSVHAGRPEPFEEFVVKPSIGAGSRDAARYRCSDRDKAVEHVARLVEMEGRSAILQPYLGRVDSEGETAVVYFGGHPSHAIRKGPLLQRGGALVEGLFAPEEITKREASDGEKRLAAAAYAAIPFAEPLYARIDMLRDGQGAPVLLELELTEPSVFLAHAPGSADRFAGLLLERIRMHSAIS